MPKKIIRITTVPLALRNLLRGQMKYMKEAGFEVIMISAEGAGYHEVIKNEECRHIIVPMTRKITPLRDFKCLLALYRIIKKERPDIVHTHTPKAGLLGMLAAFFCGIKIRIHTVAGLPLMTEKGFRLHLLKFIEKLTYRAASNVWPNSKSLYNYIIDNKFASPKKLKVIGKGSSNGIDLARFDPSKLNHKILDAVSNSFQYDPSCNYLLFIGRLVSDKGISELVNAFIRIQPTYPNLKLILVGSFENELDPLPTNVLTNIENHPSIIHVGWTENGAYYMTLANYFIFPSHREGFPNVILQAGAMDLPVICSRIPGNVDIVKDGVTGLLFDIADEGMLMEKIEYALKNEEAMQKMAQTLKKTVITEFPQEKIWKLIYEEYTGMIRQNEKELQ